MDILSGNNEKENEQEYVNNSDEKYLGSVNLKIIRYSNINKSEIFYFDKEKDIFKGFGPL